jgi:hypothetical protein
MIRYLLATFTLLIFVTGFSQNVSIENQFPLGSSLIDNARKTTMDSNGNLLILGTFSDDLDFDPSTEESVVNPLGSPDVFLASYSNDGMTLNWVINIGRIALSNGMTARGLAVDSEDNIYIAGSFSLTVDFDPGPESASLTAVQGQDGFLAKYSNAGEFIWVKQFGGEGTDILTALTIDGSDNVVTAVRFSGELDLDPSEESEFLVSPQGGNDVSLVKLDSEGNYQWSYNVSPGANNERVSSLAATSDGRVVIGATVNGSGAGIPEQSLWTGVLNSDGTESWSYDFMNQDQSNNISHIAFSEDEQFIYLGGRIQGTTDFDPSAETVEIDPTFADPFVSKHALATGTLEWVRAVDSDALEDFCAGVNEANGILYFSGTFDVQAFFDPSDFTAFVVSNGSTDVFIASYDAATGDYLDVQTFGGAGGEVAEDTFFGDEDGAVIVGAFSASLSLVDGESVDAVGFTDAFVSKYSYLYNLSTDNTLKEANVSIYPVPATDRVTIQLSEVHEEKVGVKLINIVGQEILHSSFARSTNRLTLDLSDIKQGIYLVEVTTEKSSVTKRMIKK